MSIAIILLVSKYALFGALASLGFAILFNVPKRSLLGCALSGAIGIATRTMLVESGLSIELATFLGALCVGFFSLYFYKFYYIPTAIFSVSGAIPMVPGVFAFKAMMGVIALSSNDADTMLLLDIASNFTKTALVLVAIAAGITAPSLLFKRFRLVM